MPRSGTKKPVIRRGVERTISAESRTPKEVEPQPQEARTIEFAEAILVKSIDKALDLLKEIDRLAKRVSIPVPPAAVEVRAALRRKDPESLDGSIIRYEVYRGIINRGFKSVMGLDLDEFSRRLTNNPLTDSRVWTSQRERPETTLENSELIDLARHLAILFLTNQLTSSFDAPLKGASTLTPNPGGIAVQLLTTMAILGSMYGEDNVNADGVSRAVRTLGAGFNEAWESQNLNFGFGGDIGTIGDLVGGFFEPADDQLIFDFSQDFLASTSDSSYREWRASSPTHSILWNLRSLDSMPAMRRLKDGAHDSKTVTGIMGLPRDLQAYVVCETTDLAGRLNDIAAILSTSYSKDILCCLVRFTGGLGGDPGTTIRGLRGIQQAMRLASAINAPRRGFGLRRFPDLMNGFMRRRVILQLVDQLDRVLNRGIVDFLSLLSLPDLEGQWGTLFRCAGIEDFAAVVTEVGDRLSTKSKDLIAELYEDYQTGQQNFKAQKSVDADDTMVESMIRLIDAVLEAVAAGTICAADDDTLPDPREVFRLIKNIAPGDHLPVLPRGDDLYRQYQTVEIETTFGRMLPSGDRTVDSLLSEDESSAIDECLQKITDESMVRFTPDTASVEQGIRDAYRRSGRAFSEEGT